jgi:hypothetical protein
MSKLVAITDCYEPGDRVLFEDYDTDTMGTIVHAVMVSNGPHQAKVSAYCATRFVTYVQRTTGDVTCLLCLALGA